MSEDVRPPNTEEPPREEGLPTLLARAQFVITGVLLLLVGGLAYYAGFHTGGKGEGGAGSAATAAKVDVNALYKPTPDLIAKGHTIFTTNCASCHGPDGYGDGPAAAALNPKPRNFHQGYFRYGGGLARVVRTITQGSPGTAMASFAGLPLEDRIAVAHFERSLEPKLEPDKPEDLEWLGVGKEGAAPGGGAAAAAGPVASPRIPIALAMKLVEAPEPDTGYVLAAVPDQGNSVGAAAYQERCASCHGRTGEGNIRVLMLGSAPYAYVTTRSLAVAKENWASDYGLFEKLVLEGLPGRMMPGNGDLSRETLRALYDYTQMLRAQQEAVTRPRS
jgi:mono/diheme cytochrome c family protein